MLLFALALLFSPSPSPDVVRYECLAQERHMEMMTCPDGSVCVAATPPAAVSCAVLPPRAPGQDWGVDTEQPAPGQVVLVSVRACDAAGNCSDWVGG